MLNTIVKPNNFGQITIPKEFRDSIGLGYDSPIKLTVNDNKIIMEPVKEEKKFNREEWMKSLLSVKETWDLSDEVKKNRKEIEKRLKKNGL